MGDIYSKASETIIWLRVETDNSTQALQMIEVLAEASMKDGGSTLSEEATEALEWLKDNPMENKYKDRWTALLKLYQGSYWNRMWIIQQIAFAKKILIFCGRRHTAWDIMVKATNAIMPGDETLRHSLTVLRLRNATGMGDVLGIAALRKLTQDASEQPGEYATLLSTIAHSHKSLAKDRRDKIYALLALTSDGRSLVALPDYEMSFQRLFTALTTSMVVATKGLDVICYGKSNYQADLPSWVPDWGNELPQTLVTDNQDDNLYNATGSLKGRVYRRSLAITEFAKNGLVLKVKGFPFDMIEGLGAVEASFQKDTDNPDHRLVQPKTITSPYVSEE